MLLYNIAQCHRMLGHVDEALIFYKNYRRRAPGAANREEIERRISELEAEQRVKQSKKAAEEREAAAAAETKAAADAEAKAAATPAPRADTTPAPSRPAPQLARGCAANQVPIPGGTFWMGDPDLDKNSKPVHKVTLSPFCMDKTEVTVTSFRACVQAGDCQPPSATVDWKDIKPEDKTKRSQFCTWGRGGLDKHPINCVDWNQASAYCESTGGRLPTETEWEYAARGNDARQYPWGNEPPDAKKLDVCGSECASMAKKRLDLTWTPLYSGDDGWPATAPVGSYPKGASPFGILDMAGNVWEWTADSFEAYSEAPATNPHRSGSTESPRVCRGGGWSSDAPALVRAALRGTNDPADRNSLLGFRCARGAKM